ncbi:histidine triad nucleotide-binding protein [Tengunoibacter tsumagoiensis]|uniref:Histidine triad nucleotide-binding protein n=1 Tax=Tengunoibacter tsumagoiensis TaxID=2014871 RepID=A0A401ZX99_9CHLR|nr:histidine triad nucleotide-binding protein [Tengunoibacter tsumagoiensis]GCE11478.1 histidine triad nucleotide-binding protein [Tengunoibacter tsumagoiensis]
MDNCIFCQIAAGKIPGTIVYQDDEVMAFRDINKQAREHIVFIPKRHLSASLADLKPEDSEILVWILTAAQQVARDLGLEHGYRLVTNSGPDATQSVFHLHFHLLGGEQLTGWLGSAHQPGREEA